MQNIKCLACRMFPINANHWGGGGKHSADKSQSLDPGCMAAGPSCLIPVWILASPGVYLDLDEGFSQQLSVLCGPDCKQMGMLQKDSYGKVNWTWPGKRTQTPCLSSTPTTGARSPLGDYPALPDGEDGFTLSPRERGLC